MVHTYDCLVRDRVNAQLKGVLISRKNAGQLSTLNPQIAWTRRRRVPNAWSEGHITQTSST